MIWGTLLGVPQTVREQDARESPLEVDPVAPAPGRLRDRRRGAGLGLALADALARAMGGAISARTESGHGSTFTVRLPLERPLEELDVRRRRSA